MQAFNFDQITPTVLHLECIKQSILKTFSSMIRETLTFLGTQANGQVSKTEGIVGIISIVGDIAWSLMLGLPKPTAITLVPKFAGFEIQYDSDDMGDIVGELANIVAGDLLARLDVIGVNASMSLPTVARGSDLELLLPDKLPSMRMGFSTAEGNFWLKIAIGQPYNHRHI